MVPGLVRCSASIEPVCVLRAAILLEELRCEADLRQPEIQNLGVAALGDENVGGLDVAVDDAFGVGGIERVGNLDGQRQNQLGFQRTPGDAVLQRQPIQKLHGDEGSPVAARRFRRWCRCWDDSGRTRPGLRAESGPRACGSLATSSGRNFRATKRPSFSVLGFVDHAHAAAAELLDDAVVRDGLADH